MDNSTAPDHLAPKSKWPRILIYFILLGIIVYLIIKLNDVEAGRNKHTQKLEQQIKDQQKTLASLNILIQSQTSQLKEYKPYQANIRAAALRDSIYKLLPFTFGETVYIMPDSLKATINAINISGNASEYSIKYQVRTRKGDYLSVSITDLKK